MRLPLITSYLLLVTYAFAQVAQLRWDVQQDRPVAHDVLIWQGETVDLMPRLVQGTLPVAVTNAPVEFRYREAALPTNTYRQVTASANTNSGVLAVRWTPDHDAGAAWYDYQIIVGSNAANPRAFGRITMRGTIGHPAPGTPPPPVALYTTRSDLQAVSNALAGEMQSLSLDRLWSADRAQFSDSTGGLWHVEAAWSLDVPESGWSTNVWGLGYPVTRAIGYPGPMFEQVWVADLLYLTVGLRLDGSADFILYDGRDGSRLWMATTNTAASVITLRPTALAESNAVLRFTPSTVRTNLYDTYIHASRLSGYPTTGDVSISVGVVSARVDQVERRLSGYAPITNAVLYDANGVSVFDTEWSTIGGYDYGFAWDTGELWGNIRLPDRYADPTPDSVITLLEAQELVAPLAPTNAPVLLNPSVSGAISLLNAAPTNLVLQLYATNDMIMVREVHK